MVVKTGTGSADTLDGEGGADTLNGLGGNDLLNCLGGNDYALGGAGNDRIFGDSGDDDLYGDIGNDSMLGDIGVDYLDGGDGADTLDCGDSNDGLVNINHDPVLGILSATFGISSVWGGAIGYAGADRIFGGAGNDVCIGGYDSDSIWGDDGNDFLFGGADADQIKGGIGHDVIRGDTGLGVNFADPTIIGGPGGDDLLYGEDGDDLIAGGAGGDTIFGGTGIDRLQGSLSNDSNSPAGYIDGADVIRGGDGNDQLRGGEGDDSLTGDKDDDQLRGDLGNDTLDGGSGVDTVSYRFDDIGLTAGVLFAFGFVGSGSGTIQVDDGRGGTDTLIDIERVQVTGSAFDDNGSAGQGDDILSGNGGADVLGGQSGHDLIDGGAGDDQLNGDRGNDTLIGGDGVDTAIYSFATHEAKVIFDASGYSGVGSGSVFADIYGSDTVEAIERLIVVGGYRNDQITGSGVDDDLSGGYNGRDTLEGGAGNDTLDGGFSTDTLIGGDGADHLYDDRYDSDPIGGGEFDNLYGGLGDDIYFINDNARAFENTNEGHDLVKIAPKTRYVLPDNVEDLELIAGDTPGAVNVSIGNVLDNQMTGNEDSNLLEGADGNDTLEGRGGADHLYGGEGADELHGELGDDTYHLQNASATVIELADEGSDTVSIKFDYVLADNVENLELAGAKNIDGTGNELDNRLTGNEGRNELSGGAGDDVLEGGGGHDQLRPGTGEDTIRIGDVGDSTGLTFDKVYAARFNVQDRLDLGIVPTDVTTYAGGILRDSQFDLDLELAVDETVLAAGAAVLFDPAAGDYETGNVKFLIVDANGFDGYQASQDYVIALYNMSGTLGVNDFIPGA